MGIVTGPITVALGFEAGTGRITIDGEPQGPSVYPAVMAAARREARGSHRARLKGGTGKKAILWGIMPKPPVE